MEAQEMVVPASTSLAAQVSRNEEASREESSIIKARVRSLVCVFIYVCISVRLSVCLSEYRGAGFTCLSFCVRSCMSGDLRVSIFLAICLVCLSVGLFKYVHLVYLYFL